MFSLSFEPVVREDLLDALSNEQAGALATFEGWVRNHNEGRKVVLLEYEAFEPLARKEALRILEEAKQRFDIIEARCVHRVGALKVGELAVWIGVTAAHRQAAFGACQFIIEEIKARLPIWKKEHYTDGSSEWVNCREHAHAH
ncbi:MAG TPA: molybdenum cofactor biosynthesis protein MoaE [Candidatus Obscuribacterales bacterium]